MLSGRIHCLRMLRRLKRWEPKQSKCLWWQSTRKSHEDKGAHYGTLGEDIKLDYELYDTHVPTTLAQKVLLGLGSSALGLLDPRRGGKNEDQFRHNFQSVLTSKHAFLYMFQFCWAIMLQKY